MMCDLSYLLQGYIAIYRNKVLAEHHAPSSVCAPGYFLVNTGCLFRYIADSLLLSLEFVYWLLLQLRSVHLTIPLQQRSPVSIEYDVMHTIVDGLGNCDSLCGKAKWYACYLPFEIDQAYFIYTAN